MTICETFYILFWGFVGIGCGVVILLILNTVFLKATEE